MGVIRARVDRLFLRFRRTGEARALARVFDCTSGELWRVASHLCRDRHDAEDALQSTFLSAIEDSSDWDEGRPLLPWLLGLLANRVREQRRRDARVVDATRLSASEAAPDPADTAAQNEFERTVVETLARLDEPYRTTLKRHLLEGLAAADLASELGVPAGTVRMRLHRGLDELRRKLPSSLVAVTVVPSQLPRDVAAQTRARVLERLEGAAAEVGVHGGRRAMAIGAATVVVLGVIVPLVINRHVAPLVPTQERANAVVAAQREERAERASSPEQNDRSAVAGNTAQTGTLRVVVRNGQTHVGVPGVRLQIEGDNQVRWPHRELVTDGAGHGEAELPPGTGSLFASDWGLDAEVQVTAGAVEEIAFDLAPDPAVEVRVVDAVGQPVTDAAVFARLTDAAQEWQLVTRVEAGVWREPLLGSHTTVFRASSPGHGMGWAVASSNQRQLQITLPSERGSIAGSVVDASGGGLAANLLLAPKGQNSFAVPLRTDAGGRFQVGNLPPGDWSLVAVLTSAETACASAEVRVTGNVTTEVVITMAKPATVDLHLRSADGAPCDDAEVELADTGAPPLPSCWFTTRGRSGSDGHCLLRLPAGSYRLRLSRGVLVEQRSIVLGVGCRTARRSCSGGRAAGGPCTC
jgi:RNA polymerase sigma-70 factor (ECF subfamily)